MAEPPKAWFQLLASKGCRIQTYSKTHRCSVYIRKVLVYLASSSDLPLTKVSWGRCPTEVGLSFHLQDKGVKVDNR